MQRLFSARSRNQENPFCSKPAIACLEHVAGGTVRKKLVENTDFHPILRQPTGIFYKNARLRFRSSAGSSLSQMNPFLTSNVNIS
jgi:hypothetical protein